MLNPPKNHEWLETLDGSYTLFSRQFSEGCHSTSGARAETVLHYVEGCQILAKAKKTDINILEVGFGLGIGFQTTVEELQKENIKSKLHFLSMELDEDLIRWWIENFKSSFSMTEIKCQDLHFFEGHDDCIKLTILCGDARIMLPLYRRYNANWRADAIYQDAFSPRKNSVLWSVEWFKELKEISRSEAILSTYSASQSIRKSLVEAGWSVLPGMPFGPKKTSTRALNFGESDPQILEAMLRSPSKPIYDRDINVSV